MKRFLLSTFMVGLIALFGLAQENYKTVKGYVVDKNGNPIPGAEVAGDGGGNTAITDADGSFNLQVHPLLKKLTAKYAGMKPRSSKISYEKDMIFILKKKNSHPVFWNLTGGTFLIGGWNYDNPCWNGNFGFMFGQLGNWGWYAKPMILEGSSTRDDIIGGLLSGGAIKSLRGEKSYIYFGVGAGLFGHDAEDYWISYYTVPDYTTANGQTFSQYNYYWDHELTCVGIADFGFILRPADHFNLNVGVTAMGGMYGTWGANLHIGFGYVF